MVSKKDWLLLMGVVVLAVIAGLVCEALNFPSFVDALRIRPGVASAEFFKVVPQFLMINWLEFTAFLTGIVSVYFATKEVIWVWPVGIVWALTTMQVMYMTPLYGEVALMGVYLVLQLHGWWSWKRGGENKTELVVRRASKILLWIIVGIIAVGTLAVHPLLVWLRNMNPIIDSFTTVGSLCAQFLLNRKYIENWVFWIVVDIVYVPLMYVRGYYAFTLLYVVFLVLAVVGLLQWIKMYKKAV